MCAAVCITSIAPAFFILWIAIHLRRATPSLCRGCLPPKIICGTSPHSSPAPLPIWILKLQKSNKQDWLQVSVLIPALAGSCDLQYCPPPISLSKETRQIMMGLESISPRLSFSLSVGLNGREESALGRERARRRQSVVFFVLSWQLFGGVDPVENR